MKYIFRIGAITLILALAALLGYYWYTNSTAEQSEVTYAVVGSVERGIVTTGIETTGTIMAAQKLDLDVYKQAKRIEAVNVLNGGKVAAGDVILSFDKSDALVAVQSTEVTVADKILARQTKLDTYADPNQSIRSLEQELAEIAIDLAQIEVDKNQAYRTYLNTNQEVIALSTQAKQRTIPTISGLYSSTQEGTYTIAVYASAAESGYSFKISGLESRTEEVIFGKAIPIGERGLKITFPTSIRGGDTYEVSIPNINAPEHVAAKETYDEAMTTLNKQAAALSVEQKNTEQELIDATREDATAFRDVSVAKADAELAEAQVALRKNYDVVKEQAIVAPFAGTVEGMENVVVGASPTRETNDSITLGTLISDDFLVTFSLGAVDVAKLNLDQKVLVTVTSFPDAPVYEAMVTEISSLPESGEVAQYSVKARIVVPEDSNFLLREGLLADIEVVQQEVSAVLRVPRSALTFTDGKATVSLIGELTTEQEQSIAQLGIISSTDGVFPSYPVPVETGLMGAFYVEIIRGLAEGDQVILAQNKESAGVVEQAQFGPGRRPNNDSDEESE